MPQPRIEDKIVAQCRREYDAGVEYKQGRVAAWRNIEDQYFNRVKKTLKGRFNIPVPVMSGFIDTLMSKIDDPPYLRFKPKEEADYRAAMKLQSFYDSQSKADDNDFESKDLDGKRMASMYGRAIHKVFGESDQQRFRFHNHVTDVYDFYCQPKGGGNLEDHLYCGEDNIFLSKSQMIAGAKTGFYNPENVHALINNLVENVIKDNEDRYNNKENRLSALGMNGAMYNFMGEGTERFVESGTTYEGTRYSVLWNLRTGLWIRCEKLADVTESNLWPWVSWATHRDPFNFWSKGPADDMYPIAESIRVLINQELENRQKRNFGQRAYDPDVFPNAAELEFRPDGLVRTKSGASKVQPIGNGIFQFQTAELNGTINLATFLDNFAGQKTGVNAATQGQAEDQKVGIYEGNIQQVSERFGLYNKSYVKCHKAIGRRFVYACKEHITRYESVKIIGEQGAVWDKLFAREIKPDFDILVESSTAELQMSELKRTKKQNALAAIRGDKELKSKVNAEWLIEQTLLEGEFSPEEIRVAQDTRNDGSREVLAVASERIQEIIEGKNPKLYRGATTGFQQKILDFAAENTDNDFGLFQRLIAYSARHDQIVTANMTRKGLQMRAEQGMGLPAATPPRRGPVTGAELPPEPQPEQGAELEALMNSNEPVTAV